MCGIAGFINAGAGEAASLDALRAMLGRIEHRGPDDDGVFVDGPLAMGMRRLSIIDIDGGAQPMWSEDRRYTLVFNGEIYNHDELRDSLVAKGYRFQSRSDSEVIVHLFSEFGHDCVRHLKGMFAFAIWDNRAKSLFLARDHMGIKPLYYVDNPAGLVFGSEIKAVLEAPTVEPALSQQALREYLSFRYVPTPRTMFDGIHALEPGHYLVHADGATEIVRYWDISYTDDGIPGMTEDEYCEELEHRVSESVRMQLMSDVPYGAFLSGGIDSSLVVAMMTKHLDHPVKTFSAGFRGASETGLSELPHAKTVAEKFGTDHHEVFVGPQDYIDLLPELAWHLDQPIADYVQPAYYVLSRAAASEVKMVLTGEGGDELFGGYVRYTGNQFARLFEAAPKPAMDAITRLGDRFIDSRRAKQALYALSQPSEAARLASWMPLFNFERLRDLMAAGAPDYDLLETVQRHLDECDSSSSLNRFLYVDSKTWLVDYLLARGDKVTMAASLEARVPYLDHTLVEFSARCPTSLKARGNGRKRLLKKVARSWIPDDIIDRKKQGFPVPVPLWLRNELREFSHDLLSTDTVVRRGLFEPTYVAQLLAEHDSGSFDHSSMIYGLINLELWQQSFFD